jgi:hypothetical protein
MDYALDPVGNRLGPGQSLPRAGGVNRPLEQPRVFDCADLWQHTLPLLEFLRARYGQLPLDGLGGSYGWSVRNTQVAAYASMRIRTLGQYIDAFRSARAGLPYLRHMSVHRALPALRRHLQHPREFEPNWVAHPWLDRLGGPELFIGQAGTGFGLLHQDHASVHVGFVQLQGEKEFVLFPPEDGRHLYTWTTRHFPYQRRNSFLHYRDLEDVASYPLLRFTRPQRIVIGPGQALLLPADWWHTTFNRTDSVSYSIRIVNHTNAGRVAAQHLKGLGRAARRLLARS